jgi:hypothetical protein
VRVPRRSAGPVATYFGIPKAASYLYGASRDADGNFIRALRGVDRAESTFRFIFDAPNGGQLEANPQADREMYASPCAMGRTTTQRAGSRSVLLPSHPGQLRVVRR